MMLRPSSPALLGLVVCGWSVAAFAQDLAQDLPAPTEGHVLDLANALDATAEARIDGLLVGIEDTTGVEMKVVTMTDIASQAANGGGAGERLEDYAARLLTAWEVGSPEANDGILILVTTRDGEARIALGTGYAPVYDERAARVLSASVLPALREGQIAAGIEGGVIAARDRLITPFLTGAPVSAGEGFEIAVPTLPGYQVPIVLAVSVLAGVLALVLRRRRMRKTCPNCGARTLTRTFELIEAPTGLAEGSGIEHLLCGNCGFTDREMQTVSRFGRGSRLRKELR